MSLISVILNIVFKKGDELRDRGLSTPKGIMRVDDLDYFGDHIEEHLLDIYYPVGTEKPLPVIISIHGGGWVYGNKEVYQYYCMHLAEKGFTVVNVNYRLAPKYKFPAALEDINAVFYWLEEHSKRFYLDLDHLFVVGDSAGAQIASQYATLLTNANYAKLFDFEIPEIKIKALGLNCGLYDPLDRLKSKGNGLIKLFIRMLLKDYLGKGILTYEEKMDFQSNIVQGFPPSFVTCSVNDVLVGCQPELLKKLKNAHIPYIYKEYGHNNKAINHVFHLDIRNDEAIKLNHEQLEFFKHFIGLRLDETNK